MRASLGITVVVSSVLTAVAASGQGVVTQRNLSLPLAKAIAEATLAECKAKIGRAHV